ncbi:hypothetical protein F5X68DRAFT_248453 [Plectosphaerella plurivora]|uniref:Uncharacterized protein n=1 Tax=Plectosphaerella plurivora TaxID=936078 RepID=A0A9P8VLE5_9PEZI|nr:hypothetical protein F5X68DRAFT_248453 [Plectosphaerella plurivora]
MLARIHEERDAWVARDIEETGHPPEPLPAEKDFSKHPDIGPGEASHLTEMYRDFVRPYIEANPPGSEPVTLADVFAGELLQMHHNMVLEDREALNGADLDSAFLYQAAYLDKRNIYHQVASRGGFFVYLDKESIERLAQVPDDEAMAVMTRDEKARLGWETWVKIVSMEGRTDPEDLSDWPVYTGVSREPSALRRLRLPLWFDFLGAVGDRRMKGMDYEGDGYEHGPGSAEWTYTPPNHYEFPGKKERMEGLYGPQKRGRY